jgi:hypothetical protein
MKRFCLACQDVQARGNCRIIEAMRCNANVSGYCLTQFQDTSIEMGAGIVDYFYGPKKILGPIQEAQKSPLMVIATDKDCYSPEEEPLGEVFLVQEQDLQGQGTLSVEIGDCGGKTGSKQELGVRIGSGRAQSVFQGPLGRMAKAGKYAIHAALKARCGGGSFKASGAREIHIFPECSYSGTPAIDCRLIEVHDVFKRRLEKLGVRTKAFAAERSPGLILLPPLTNSFAHYPMDRIRRALDEVRVGATLVVFELPIDAHLVAANPLADVLGEGFTMNAAEGIFLGAFHWYRKSGFFREIGEGGLMDERFSKTHPVVTLSDAKGQSWAGTFTMWPSLLWGSDLLTIDYHAGKVIVCQLRILEHLEEDIVARHLFKNIITFGGGK